MVEERIWFQKFLFPNLNSILSVDGRSVHPVDLRWGVSESQVVSGDFIRHCINQASSSDVVIGLLGTRYGTPLQPNFFKKLALTEPWISNYPNTSLTELEIRAALRRAEIDDGQKPLVVIGRKADNWSYVEQSSRLHLPEAFRNTNPSEFVDSNIQFMTRRASLIHELTRLPIHSFCYSDANECCQKLLDILKPELNSRVTATEQSAEVNQWKNSLGYTRIAAKFEHIERCIYASEKRLRIIGSAGVGKTQLLMDVATHFHNRNYRVVFISHSNHSTLSDALFEQQGSTFKLSLIHI